MFQKVHSPTPQSNQVDYNGNACINENMLTCGLRKETSILDCV